MIPRSPEKEPNSGGMSRVMEDVSDAIHTHGLTNSRLEADCLLG